MSQKSSKTGLMLLSTAVAGLLLYKNGERWSRNGLIYLSTADWVRQIMTQTPLAWQVASRFVAGEQLAEALQVTKDLNNQGALVTLDFLGESVKDEAEAAAACNQIIATLDAIAAQGLQANVSLKLTQLGLRIREEVAVNNLRRILDHAQKLNNRVRLDMEESATVDTTLRLYRQMRDDEGYANVGVVMQAYLYRTMADIEQLVAEGGWVRLCKGAYAEPADIAFPVKADTDANYVALMQRLLSATARQNGTYAGIATHDPNMIAATKLYAHETAVPLSDFEFQMLYGIRRELQEQLVQEGYRLRVYVPYGTAWYPYFMRRLAERPANLWFFLSNIFRQ